MNQCFFHRYVKKIRHFFETSLPAPISSLCQCIFPLQGFFICTILFYGKNTGTRKGAIPTHDLDSVDIGIRPSEGRPRDQ